MSVTLQCVQNGDTDDPLTWLEQPGDAVLAVAAGTSVTLAGDVVDKYGVGTLFCLVGTPDNDGDHTSGGASLVNGNTVVLYNAFFIQVDPAGHACLYRLPVEADEVDMNGYGPNQTGPLSFASIQDLSEVGGGSFYLSDDLTCPLVTDVMLVCGTHKLLAGDDLTASVAHQAGVGFYDDIVSAIEGESVTVNGDQSASYSEQTPFYIFGTADNDGTYESDGCTYDEENDVTVVDCAEIPHDQAGSGGHTQPVYAAGSAFLIDAGPFGSIESISASAPSITLSGDVSGTYGQGAAFWVHDTPEDDSYYESDGASYDSENDVTVVTLVSGPPHDQSAPGGITRLTTDTGNVSYWYPAGTKFLAEGTANGGANDGEYVVASPGAWFSYTDNATIIPVYNSLLADAPDESGAALRRHVPIAITTGYAANGEGIYCENYDGLVLQDGSEVCLIGDITNLNTESQTACVYFQSQGEITSWHGDCIIDDVSNGIGINFYAGGMVTYWQGDLVNSGDQSGSYGIWFGGTGEIVQWVGDCINDNAATGIMLDNGGTIDDWTGDCLNSSSAQGVYNYAGTIVNWTGECINTGTSTGIFLDVGGTIQTWTHTAASKQFPGDTLVGGGGGVYPAEENVSTVETAYGPNGDDYAGELDLGLYVLKTDVVAGGVLEA